MNEMRARVADQRIVERRADDDGEARNRAHFGARLRQNAGGLVGVDRARDRRKGHGVITAAADQRIAPAARDDAIVARPAVDAVVARPRGDRVFARRAQNRIVAAAAEDQVARGLVAPGIADGVGVDRVVALAAGEDVVVTPGDGLGLFGRRVGLRDGGDVLAVADDRAAAVAPLQRVVAGAAVEVIGDAIAGVIVDDDAVVAVGGDGLDQTYVAVNLLREDVGAALRLISDDRVIVVGGDGEVLVGIGLVVVDVVVVFGDGVAGRVGRRFAALGEFAVDVVVEAEVRHLADIQVEFAGLLMIEGERVKVAEVQLVLGEFEQHQRADDVAAVRERPEPEIDRNVPARVEIDLAGEQERAELPGVGEIVVERHGVGGIVGVEPRRARPAIGEGAVVEQMRAVLARRLVIVLRQRHGVVGFQTAAHVERGDERADVGAEVDVGVERGDG